VTVTPAFPKNSLESGIKNLQTQANTQPLAFGTPWIIHKIAGLHNQTTTKVITSTWLKR
jgi:hypothetical protein